MEIDAEQLNVAHDPSTGRFQVGNQPVAFSRKLCIPIVKVVHARLQFFQDEAPRMFQGVPCFCRFLFTVNDQFVDRLKPCPFG